MRFNSLAFRLFATAAAWTLLVLPIAGFIIYGLYRDDVQASFDGQLLKLVNAITVDSMGSSGDAQPLPPSNLYEPLFEVTHSGWYWQITPLAPANGRKLVSPSLATGSLPSPAAKKVNPDESGARWLNIKGPKGEPLRIVEVIDSLGHEPGKPTYSIVVGGPQDWLDHLVANFRYRLTTALALAGLGLVAVTLFQVRFGLLPLRQIERGLAGIRSGTSSTLEGDLPAEIEPLQSELNALIRSNQAIVDRARTQVGNLAHALKTPLAVITNEARGDKTGLGDKVVEQADIMRQSMTRYLDRARMAARVGVIGRVTQVAPVIEPLVRTLQRIHQDKGVVIEVDCPAEARFSGEKQDLEEMLGNLLDNACKWA
ncbi:MAG: histidine kinase, partial [Hyphomicrobium sp.]|nr:histidine kinase [Hyphomicrobium sp.]